MKTRYQNIRGMSSCLAQFGVGGFIVLGLGVFGFAISGFGGGSNTLIAMFGPNNLALVFWGAVLLVVIVGPIFGFALFISQMVDAYADMADNSHTTVALLRRLNRELTPGGGGDGQ